MSNRLLFQYIFINLLIAAPQSSQCLWKCPVSSTCSWSHHSFTHLFDKLLLHTYYVPASVSVAQDVEVHWREKTSPCLHRAYMLVAERDRLYLAHSRIVSFTCKLLWTRAEPYISLLLGWCSLPLLPTWVHTWPKRFHSCQFGYGLVCRCCMGWIQSPCKHLWRDYITIWLWNKTLLCRSQRPRCGV